MRDQRVTVPVPTPRSTLKINAVNVLMLIAIILLALAALDVGGGPLSLGWAGLALWAAATVMRK